MLKDAFSDLPADDDEAVTGFSAEVLSMGGR